MEWNDWAYIAVVLVGILGFIANVILPRSPAKTRLVNRYCDFVDARRDIR